MQGFNTYNDWYADKTPEYALAETQGNWAVDNAAIINVKVNEVTDDENDVETYYIEFTTAAGKFDFSMQYDPKEFLAKAYGGRCGKPEAREAFAASVGRNSSHSFS